MEIEEAIENGRARADEILKIRKQAKFKRAAAVRKLQSAVRKGKHHSPSASSASSAVASSAGTLIGEGDSWFDYPFSDILKILEDDYAYDVESVAHHGDLIEDMAYTGQLEKFTSRLEKLLRNNTIPKAVLLSGGGNDLAGLEFGALLNHSVSPHIGFNDRVVDGVIDERLRDAYITTLTSRFRRRDGNARHRRL